ncbi:AEC family transporter [Oscillospiraceae bacterium MB08-C2-2]|nr:AEC family transporter [Oscillospiraceae bacterium MB08-C2-2]
MIKLQMTLFLLMGVGFWAAKKGLLTAEVRKKVSDLFIAVILPCSIIQSFLIEFTYDRILKSGWILLISICAQIFYLILSKLLYRSIPKEQRIILQYATICSNAGFMGNPVAFGVFGHEGLFYASISLIPLRFFMWSAGLSLFTATDRKKVLKTLATHPCILAVVIGFVLMLTGLRPPEFLGDAIAYIGSCTTAISMFVIGGILASADIKGSLLDRRLLYFSVVRLLLIPISLYAVLSLLRIDSLLVGVTVLLAAMPAGSTTAMLAEKYGCDSDFASRCVFMSIILSMLTLPLWGLLIGQ